MANKEFYSVEEFRKQTEYKPFAAELYAKSPEFANGAPEIAKGAPENKFAEEPAKKEEKPASTKQGKRRQNLKKILNRVNDSATKFLGTTAGTVAAAAAAVAVGTNILTPVGITAQIEKIFLGANYAAVQLAVTELTEKEDFYLLVTGDGEERYFEGMDLGVNEYLLRGLQPNQRYLVQVVDGNGKSYFQTELTTEDENGEFLSESFLGEYRRLSPDEATVIWGEESHIVELDLGFTAESDLYAYRVALVDESGEELAFYEGRDKTVKMEVPAKAEQATILYEEWFVGEEFRYLYESEETADAILLSAPKILFSEEKILESTNYYKIPYRLESAREEDELLDFSLWINGTQLGIGTPALNEPYWLGVEVEAGQEQFTLSAQMTVAGAYGGYERTVQTESLVYQNAQEFYADVYASYTGGKEIVMDFAYFAEAGAYVEVTDLATGTAERVENSYFSVSVEEGIYEYSYALYDSGGTPLTEAETVRFDTSYTASFEATYPNPGDVLITFNDDGTHNIYFDMKFSSENPEVYYEIHYSDATHGINGVLKSNESVVVVEDLFRETYSLIYKFWGELDGVRYLLYQMSPSGATGEFYPPNMGVVSYSGSEVQLKFYANTMLDGEIKLTVNGKEYLVAVEELTALEEGGYTYTLDIGEEVTEASVGFYGNAARFTYESIAEQIGEENIKGKAYIWLVL